MNKFIHMSVPWDNPDGTSGVERFMDVIPCHMMGGYTVDWLTRNFRLNVAYDQAHARQLICRYRRAIAFISVMNMCGAQSDNWKDSFGKCGLAKPPWSFNELIWEDINGRTIVTVECQDLVADLPAIRHWAETHGWGIWVEAQGIWYTSSPLIALCPSGYARDLGSRLYQASSRIDNINRQQLAQRETNVVKIR